MINFFGQLGEKYPRLGTEPEALCLMYKCSTSQLPNHGQYSEDIYHWRTIGNFIVPAIADITDELDQW